MDRLMTLVDSQFVYALGWSIVHSFWQCLVVCVLLSFALVINKRARPITRYWLCVIALGCCLLISAKTFIYCYQDITQARELLSQLQSALTASNPDSGWQWVYQAINPWLNYIVLVWIMGFVVQALRYLTDLVFTHQLKSQAVSAVPHDWQRRFQILVKKLAIDKNVRFLQSTKVLVPCVIGHIKPVVLLPLGILSQLPQAQVEAIMLHELAHVKRHDYLLNIVQCVIKVLFFFNPFVLAISKKIDIEREHCCDDLAVNVCGSPLTFAHSLSRFADITNHSQTAIAASKDKYLLLARVKRLFAQPNRLSKSVECIIALGCVTILGLTLNVNAGTQPKTKKQDTQIVPTQTQEPLYDQQNKSIEPQTNNLSQTNRQTQSDSQADTSVEVTEPKEVVASTTPQVALIIPQVTSNNKKPEQTTEIKHVTADVTENDKIQNNEVNIPVATEENASKAATDYLTQVNNTKVEGNVERLQDSTIHLKTDKLEESPSLLKPVELPKFEKLVSAPLEYLRGFKYLVHAPLGLEDLRLVSRSSKWKDSTLDYLKNLNVEHSEALRIKDNKLVSTSQIPVNEKSTLVAQIRFKEILHERKINGECKVPAIVNGRLGTGQTPSFCQYVDKIKLRFEVILLDPYKNRITLYGRKVIESDSESSSHKIFNTDYWQANQEANVWEQLFQIINSDVYLALHQSEYHLEKNPQQFVSNDEIELLARTAISTATTNYITKIKNHEETMVQQRDSGAPPIRLSQLNNVVPSSGLLMTIPAEQLSTFKHIVFAPVDTQNTEFIHKKEKWQEVTRAHLDSMNKEKFSVVRLADNSLLTPEKYDEISTTPLIAQLRLLQAQIRRSGSCVKPGVNAYYYRTEVNGAWAGRPDSVEACDYKHYLAAKMEIVIIHPVSKDILFAGHFPISSYRIRGGRNISISKWQEELQLPAWQELLSLSQQAVVNSVKRAQQGKPDETQLTLRANDFTFDATNLDLPQVESVIFEKLYAAEDKQLGAFSHILFSPMVTDNAGVTTSDGQGKKWVEASMEYLLKMEQQYTISSLNVEDKEQDKVQDKDVDVGSVLVAQVKLKQVLHNRESKCLTGKPFVTRQIVERANKQYRPTRARHSRNNKKCQYSDLFNNVIDLVVIHPVSKDVLIYGQTTVENYGYSATGKAINMKKWRSDNVAEFWLDLIEQINRQVIETIIPLQQSDNLAQTI